MEDYVVKKCPHCNMLVILPKMHFNCMIYRHGVYKDTLEQMDPHLKKPICDKLARDGLIYGCGKPFKITQIAYNNYVISKCGYI